MKRSLNFILAVVIIGAFHYATALKCFNDDNYNLCADTPDGEVVECPSSISNPGCHIFEIDNTPTNGDCVRACVDKFIEGCFYQEIDGKKHIKECICTSDLCNENFETAGWLEKH